MGEYLPQAQLEFWDFKPQWDFTRIHKEPSWNGVISYNLVGGSVVWNMAGL